jgi:hypothetical protein
MREGGTFPVKLHVGTDAPSIPSRSDAESPQLDESPRNLYHGLIRTHSHFIEVIHVRTYL